MTKRKSYLRTPEGAPAIGQEPHHFWTDDISRMAWLLRMYSLGQAKYMNRTSDTADWCAGSWENCNYVGCDVSLDPRYQNATQYSEDYGSGDKPFWYGDESKGNAALDSWLLLDGVTPKNVYGFDQSAPVVWFAHDWTAKRSVTSITDVTITTSLGDIVDWQIGMPIRVRDANSSAVYRVKDYTTAGGSIDVELMDMDENDIFELPFTPTYCHCDFGGDWYAGVGLWFWSESGAGVLSPLAHPPIGGKWSIDTVMYGPSGSPGGWVRFAIPDRYYHFSGNSHRYVTGGVARGSWADRDFGSVSWWCPSDRLLPECTDGKVASLTPLEYEDTGRIDWRYDKTELAAKLLTDATNLVSQFGVISGRYTESELTGHRTFYQQASNYCRHYMPPVDSDSALVSIFQGVFDTLLPTAEVSRSVFSQEGNTAWSENDCTNVQPAYQNYIQWLISSVEEKFTLPVDDDYKENYIAWVNWINGTTLTVDDWLDSYPQVAVLTDPNWGCNGSGWELILKKTGDCSWYYDSVNPWQDPRVLAIRDEYTAYQSNVSPPLWWGSAADYYLPLSVGTWRRVPRYTCGRMGVMSSEPVPGSDYSGQTGTPSPAVTPDPLIYHGTDYPWSDYYPWTGVFPWPKTEYVDSVGVNTFCSTGYTVDEATLPCYTDVAFSDVDDNIKTVTTNVLTPGAVVIIGSAYNQIVDCWINGSTFIKLRDAVPGSGTLAFSAVLSERHDPVESVNGLDKYPPSRMVDVLQDIYTGLGLLTNFLVGLSPSYWILADNSIPLNGSTIETETVPCIVGNPDCYDGVVTGYVIHKPADSPVAAWLGSKAKDLLVAGDALEYGTYFKDFPTGSLGAVAPWDSNTTYVVGDIVWKSSFHKAVVAGAGDPTGAGYYDWEHLVGKLATCGWDTGLTMSVDTVNSGGTLETLSLGSETFCTGYGTITNEIQTCSPPPNYYVSGYKYNNPYYNPCPVLIIEFPGLGDYAVSESALSLSVDLYVCKSYLTGTARIIGNVGVITPPDNGDIMRLRVTATLSEDSNYVAVPVCTNSGMIEAYTTDGNGANRIWYTGGAVVQVAAVAEPMPAIEIDNEFVPTSWFDRDNTRSWLRSSDPLTDVLAPRPTPEILVAEISLMPSSSDIYVLELRSRRCEDYELHGVNYNWFLVQGSEELMTLATATFHVSYVRFGPSETLGPLWDWMTTNSCGVGDLDAMLLVADDLNNQCPTVVESVAFNDVVGRYGLVGSFESGPTVVVTEGNYTIVFTIDVVFASIAQQYSYQYRFGSGSWTTITLDTAERSVIFDWDESQSIGFRVHGPGQYWSEESLIVATS